MHSRCHKNGVSDRSAHAGKYEIGISQDERGSAQDGGGSNQEVGDGAVRVKVYGV